MNERALRYLKLMKTMKADPMEEEILQPEAPTVEMAPAKIEAVTGAEQPEMAKKRQMQMLVDSKISQLEQSDDPMALESLNYWKQKRKELESN